jgi:ribonuclease G
MKKIFIDHQKGMTRTAVVSGGKLREIFFDHACNGSIVGRVYMGIVRNILPGQFAFVDIGFNKNAFLNKVDESNIRIGQPVLVQAYRDASGSKGAYVGQEIHFKGRLLIIYASPTPEIGISQKITDKKTRKRLKGFVRNALPDGYGAIIRTNAQEAAEPEIVGEVEVLINRHQHIAQKAKYARPPVLLYQENSLLDDLLSDDVTEIITGAGVSIETSIPTHISIIKTDDEFLFDNQNITKQIRNALEKKVNLPSGGFITIEQTEACVVIDVNSGHETARIANLKAAECIAWQLALRNLSGMIIVDFIDMENNEDKKFLMFTLDEHLKKERVKTEIIGMTELGLVQLTRKKTRESLSRLLQKNCSHCNGSGRVNESHLL